MFYERQLDNGLRIICEKIDHFHSVSIGIWEGVGSFNENEKENGLSHFIEHMMFKGTAKRTAKDIAVCMDSIGGQMNAFTSKECTCYYAKVIDEHIETAFELLTDMFFHSKFDEDDIKKEKGVILEEINMVEDEPEELVHEVIAGLFFNDNPIAKPVLGSRENVSSFTRNDIQNYINNHYNPKETVISIAGNYDEKQVDDLIDKYIKIWPYSKKANNTDSKLNLKKSYTVKEKENEQTHVCIAFPGVATGDDELYPLMILNNIIGGGMSSRMFQKIREEMGLAYSVYSYPATFRNSGMFTIYAGMRPDQSHDAIKVILEELDSIKKTGVTKNEFLQSKEQLKGNLVLGSESNGSRMMSNGKAKLLLDRVRTDSEILDKINNVTPDQLKKVTDKVLDFDYVNIAAVGKIDKSLHIENLI